MDICRKHDFGKGEIEAFELGYGPIGRPFMTVFFYLMDGILIDTGQSNMRKDFVELVRDRRIDRVLLTHHHEDHSGNVLPIQKIKNVPVYGHPLTAEKLKKGFRIMPYQIYTWGKADKVEIEHLPPQIETERFSFITIHTPGHSKDHTVFLEKERGWLFSGDLFLGPRIKYFRADEKLKDSIESLRKVLQYDFETLFCSLNPQPRNGKQMLQRKLENLEDLYGKVEKLVHEGYDEKSIIKIMGEEIKLIKYITFGNVSRAHMIGAAIRDIRKGAR